MFGFWSNWGSNQVLVMDYVLSMVLEIPRRL